MSLTPRVLGAFNGGDPVGMSPRSSAVENKNPWARSLGACCLDYDSMTSKFVDVTKGSLQQMRYFAASCDMLRCFFRIPQRTLTPLDRPNRCNFEVTIVNGRKAELAVHNRAFVID